MKASSARQGICRNVKDEEKEGFIDGSISTLALFINENVSVEFEGAHALCQYSNIDYKPKKTYRNIFIDTYLPKYRNMPVIRQHLIYVYIHA